MSRPARGGRAYHREKDEHPENAVQSFIGIAADHEKSNAAEADAKDDALQQRAGVISFRWRRWLAPTREARVNAGVDSPHDALPLTARDFARAFTRRFPPVLVVLRSQARLRLAGRTRTLSDHPRSEPADHAGAPGPRHRREPYCTNMTTRPVSVIDHRVGTW